MKIVLKYFTIFSALLKSTLCNWCVQFQQLLSAEHDKWETCKREELDLLRQELEQEQSRAQTYMQQLSGARQVAYCVWLESV